MRWIETDLLRGGIHMLGSNFPITDYYRDNLVDAVTISRAGGWWTAMLLINDPSSGRPFVKLYRWQQTDRGWKMRGSFKLNSAKDTNAVVKALGDFVGRLG